MIMKDKLKGSSEYGEIFELVRDAVREAIGKQRSGLMLVLGDLPPQIGALHSMGSNAIVMNKAIMDALEVVIKEKEDRNAVIFDFLLHEYLHSLGYVSEDEVRSISRDICEKNFGKDHLTTKMAFNGPWTLYPQLAWIRPRSFDESATIVKNFDRSSTSYIS